MTNKFIGLFLFITSLCISQTQQTRVLYKAEYVLKNANDIKNKSPERQAVIDQYISNCSKVEMELIYNNKESIFRAIDGLEKNDDLYYNIAKSLITEDMVVYKNNDENCFIIQKNVSDEKYIYAQEDKYVWTIHNDTTTINGMKCFKATTKIIAKQYVGLPVFKDREYTVWFTPEIPASCGPFGFSGLPGLVLSLSKGSFHIYAAEIDFKNNISFNKPTKGIVLKNENELNEIFYKQIKEFQSES